MRHPAKYNDKLLPVFVEMIKKVGASTILDPFAGSGTVGVVAQKLGRGFVGIELNPEYVKLAETRMMDTPVSLFNQSILEEL